MDDYLLEKLATLTKIPVVLQRGDNIITYYKLDAPNPILLSEELRSLLIQNAGDQEVPVIICDEFQVHFACVKDGEDAYLIGPMATDVMDFGHRRAFYRAYGYTGEEDRGLKAFTASEILNFLQAVIRIITGQTYSDTELIKANNLENIQSSEDSIRFDIQSDEEDIFRHSYQEERRLLDEVRNGNPEGAVSRTHAMDPEIGQLGKTSAEHWRNMLVIAATLCARAAIQGGVPPYIAYRTSGYYINKGSNTGDIMKITGYRDQAVFKLAELVKEQLEKKHTSSYVLQTQDYVTKHYREKIYLAEVADKLGISESYLSRLFKKEVGKNLSEYIIEVRVERAANLLRYSDESIPRIAEYVQFPSQSYFGKMFKKYKNMTPREYREKNKPQEFSEEE